jgi:hypothetical protein
MWEKTIAIGTVIITLQGCVLIWLAFNRPPVPWLAIAVYAAVVAALCVTTIFSFKTLRLRQRSTDETPKAEGSHFGKLADEDSADMSKRLILCGTSAIPCMEGVEPYVDVIFRIVNASVFSVMASGTVEGNAMYIGYSGERHPLRRPELTETLILNHAGVGNLKVRQFVPLSFTDNIAAGGGKIRIDFSLVQFKFRSPETRPFIWFGDEVEVRFPQRP